MGRHETALRSREQAEGQEDAAFQLPHTSFHELRQPSAAFHELRQPSLAFQELLDERRLVVVI